jgi:hypothetical protein
MHPEARYRENWLRLANFRFLLGTFPRLDGSQALRKDEGYADIRERSLTTAEARNATARAEGAARKTGAAEAETAPREQRSRPQGQGAGLGASI